MRWIVLCWIAVGCAGRAPTLPVAQPADHTFSAPADARAWLLRAVTAEQRGDIDTMRHALQWVVRLDRASPWSWLAKARVEERAGLPEAGAAYLEALDLALETSNLAAAEQVMQGVQGSPTAIEAGRRVGRWMTNDEESVAFRSKWWVEVVNP